MRTFKFILVLLLMCTACFAQEPVYKYKRMSLYATSDKGTVRKVSNEAFQLKDSTLFITVTMDELRVACVSVQNLSSKPILIKWATVGCWSDHHDYLSYTDAYFLRPYPQSDVITLYKGGSKLFAQNNYLSDMFSKRKGGETGGVNVTAIIDDTEVDYRINLRTEVEKK